MILDFASTTANGLVATHFIQQLYFFYVLQWCYRTTMTHGFPVSSQLMPDALSNLRAKMAYDDANGVNFPSSSAPKPVATGSNWWREAVAR